MITLQETSLSAVRLLGLRRFPGLERVDVDDLAKLLGATTERTIPAGTRLAKRGAPLGAAWFVIEGELRTTGRNGSRSVGPNQTAGMIEMVSEHREGLDIDCVTDAVVLELDKADFLAFCAENFDMLEALLRNIGAHVLARAPLEGTEQASLRSWTAGTCRFVDRLLFLHALTSFGPFGGETIADLAAALDERRESGVLVPAGRAIDRLYVVVDGSLRFGSSEFGPGSIFGFLHCVAELPLPYDLVATETTTVLSCGREIVTDLLEDNVPFALGWLQRLAQRLVERTPALTAS